MTKSSNNIDEFIATWNNTHANDLIFSVAKTADGRPINVSIRYVPVAHRENCTHDAWTRLKFVLNTKSHGAMCITTAEQLLQKGIIEIAVNCQTHTYKEANVVATLRWLAEIFFAAAPRTAE